MGGWVDTYRQDVGVKGVEVDHQVDAGLVKDLHAFRVVGLGVHVVDAQRVCAERLHQRGISSALLAVDERVVWGAFASAKRSRDMLHSKELTFDQLVGNALCKELLAAAGKELVPDGRDLLDGVGRGGAQDGGREPRKLHSVAMSAKTRDGRKKGGIDGDWRRTGDRPN